MAAKSAIGIRREAAMKKLHQEMARLFGEGFTLPTQGRDPGLLHAVQLEYIANFLEQQTTDETDDGGLAELTELNETIIKASAQKPPRKPGKKAKRANAHT